MPAAVSVENCLSLTGQMVSACETRTSPAGVAIGRFLLEHQSTQLEVDIPREVRCRIPVVACGDPLNQRVRGVPAGSSIRVQGFISRANYREGEYRLVLHATHIEILARASVIDCN